MLANLPGVGPDYAPAAAGAYQSDFGAYPRIREERMGVASNQTPENEADLGRAQTMAVVRTRLRSQRRVAVACSVCLTVGAFVSWRLSLGYIDPYDSTASGLVTKLPALWWVALILSVSGIVVALLPDVPNPVAMTLALFGIVMLFHGTLPATEPVARFASAYDVAGFSGYIGSTGHTLPLLDARMLWPGVFSAAGMAAKSMNVPTYWFLGWAPVVFNLAYLLPIKAIANATIKTSRARWAALPLFVVGNWIDQDYFSPQAVNLFLYLTVIALVIRAFGAANDYPSIVVRFARSRFSTAWLGAIRGALRIPADKLSVEETTPTAPPDLRGWVFAIVLILIFASVVSHQFTPAVMVATLFGLALVGRTHLRMLWLVVAVLVISWLCWIGETYWVGHFRQVFGGITQPGASLDTNVTSRIGSTSFGRSVVQDSRAAAAALTIAGGVLALAMAARRQRTHWTLPVLLIMPASVSLGVTYGGEAALRVLLFALAPAVIVVAGSLDFVSSKKSFLALPLVFGLLLAGLFPLTRFGNEQFEALTPSDVDAAQYVQQHIPQNGYVLVVNGDTPLHGDNVGGFTVTTDGGILLSPPNVLTSSLQAVSSQRAVWIYLSRGQDEFGQANNGFPAGWMQDVEQSVLSTGRAKVLDRTTTAVVMDWLAPGSTNGPNQ